MAAEDTCGAAHIPQRPELRSPSSPQKPLTLTTMICISKAPSRASRPSSTSTRQHPAPISPQRIGRAVEFNTDPWKPDDVIHALEVRPDTRVYLVDVLLTPRAPRAFDRDQFDTRISLIATELPNMKPDVALFADTRVGKEAFARILIVGPEGSLRLQRGIEEILNNRISEMYPDCKVRFTIRELYRKEAYMLLKRMPEGGDVRFEMTT